MSLLLLLAISATPPQQLDAAEVRLVTQRFAACAVRGEPKLAATFVLNAGVRLTDRQFRRLISSDCVRTEGSSWALLRARREQMRYVLAEALIRRELPDFSAAMIGSAAPLDHRVVFAAAAGRDAKLLTEEQRVSIDKESHVNEALSMLGECVVRSEPTISHRLLFTTPGSAEESTYLVRLAPVSGNCVEKGAAVTLTKFTLRGSIALNLYRLAVTSRQAAGGMN